MCDHPGITKSNTGSLKSLVHVEQFIEMVDIVLSLGYIEVGFQLKQMGMSSAKVKKKNAIISFSIYFYFVPTIFSQLSVLGPFGLFKSVRLNRVRFFSRKVLRYFSDR